jgi:methylglutaconyl-CoA hydratase
MRCDDHGMSLPEPAKACGNLPYNPTTGGARRAWNAETVPERVLRVERDGTNARVVVDRPDVRNAFNAELITALREAFLHLGSDDGVRSIVLSGTGKTFSGGADLAWMRGALDLGEDDNVRDAEAMAAMFRAIDGCPKPVIARVQGAALGGGCGLVAAADIAVATDDAFFGFTEVTLGLIPAVIAPFVIAKIGVSQARALFVTGQRFDAQRARAIGLVHDVVAPAALDAHVDALVHGCRTTGREAVRAAKELIATVARTNPAEIDAFTTRAIAQRRVSAEGQEGLRAFLERRAPSWNEA